MILSGRGTVFPQEIWKSMGVFLVGTVPWEERGDAPLAFGGQGPRITV